MSQPVDVIREALKDGMDLVLFVREHGASEVTKLAWSSFDELTVDALAALDALQAQIERAEAQARAAEDAADEMRAWFRDLEVNVASKARAAQLLGRGPVALPGKDELVGPWVNYCPRCGKRADASSIVRRGCEHEFHSSADVFVAAPTGREEEG